jgi:hypothetical protein
VIEMIVLRNDRAAKEASRGASVTAECFQSNRQHLVVTTRSYDGNVPELFCFEQGGIPEKIF